MAGRSKQTGLILPPDVRDALRAIIHENVDAYIQTGKVDDKGGKLVDFHYNFEQRIIARDQRIAERERRPFRGMYLKTRQRGVSTQNARRNWVYTWSGDFTQCVTVAQREATATSLLEKMRSADRRLEPFLQFKKSHDSDYQISYAEFDSCMWIVSTANLSLVKMVRGRTAQKIHATEGPLWPDFLNTLSEMQSVCHAEPGTSILLEWTGIGRESGAHKFWKDTRAGKTPYFARFLAWQDDPLTDLDRGVWTDAERHSKMLQVHDEYPELIKRGQKFNLSCGQVWQSYLWLRDVKLGQMDKFLEDYPCDEDEAWQATGDLYYDDNDLIQIEAAAIKYPRLSFELGLLELEDGFTSFSQLKENKEMTHETELPYIFVWAPPVPGRQYVVSSMATPGNAGSLPSAGCVIDMHSGEQMAEFGGFIKPHQLGALVYSIGKVFNDAVAAPEVNTSAGMATLAELQRLRYPRIYIWKHFDDADQKMTNKAGWYTGEKGIHLTLTLLARVLEQASTGLLPLHRNLLRSLGLIKEMRTFITNSDTGVPEPQPTCSDSRIKAIAIAWYVADMETRGREDSILNALRPCQILTVGNNLVNSQGMSVEDAIARAKQYLNQRGYTQVEGNYDETPHWWGKSEPRW